MLKKIETLRTRPKQVRNQYAFWIALSITGIIAFFWALSLPSRFAVVVPQNQEENNQAGIVSRNLSDIKASLVQLFTSFGTDSEYTKPIEKPTMIDFNALIASSSIHEASGTQEMTTTTEEKATTSIPYP